VTEQDPKKVYEQALQIADIAPQVVVKIPCHIDYYPIIHQLVQKGIKLNITLVFSLVQSLLMCKLNVHYISPFVGRLDDIGESGIQLIKDIRSMIDRYHYDTQILAASLRSISHIYDVILAGADIATVPVDIMQKMVSHPLTNVGIEKFLADWKSLKISRFP
jgi:transaldolase